jgi:hypothetical protein
MTIDEAKQEAVKRWGSNGTAVFLKRDQQCRVGIRVFGSQHTIKTKGIGNSWEEAFANVKPNKGA